MKKLFYSAAALALAFFAGSCQQENLEPVKTGSNTVTYTVQVPDAIATKAFADNYTLNYEVYREGDIDYLDRKPVYEGTETFNNGTASFNLELVKNQNFVVLFWAQHSQLQANTQTPVYNISDLRQVSINSANVGGSNNVNASVFAGKDRVENCVSAKGGDVILERPISQLNIYTTEASLKVGNNDSFSLVAIERSSVTVSGLYSTYNVADEEVVINMEDESSSTCSCTFTEAPVADLTAPAGYVYVAMNYVGFAHQDGSTVDVDFTIYTENDGNIPHSVSSVPVKPNYRTNIVGNLISGQTDYNVSLEEVWAGKNDVQVGVMIGEVCYQTLAEAYAAAEDGDELVVIGGILLDKKFIIEKNITLNLNGNLITTTYDAAAQKHLYAFEVKANTAVVIKNGTIESRGIYNYGTLTIEEGAVIDGCDANGGYAIYNAGTFVMNGGEVKTSYEDDNLVDKGGYDATTIYTSGNTTINSGEVNNISDYTFALDIQGGEVTVNGGKFTSIHSTVSNRGTLTINGGEFICNGLEGITAHALVAWGGSTTTINGGTFDGKDNYNGFNVDAVAGATVYIKGGEFKSVHSGSLYGDGTIIVSGGIFFDKIADARLQDGCTIEQLQDGTWKVEGKGWYQDAQGNYHIEGAKGWQWMADQTDSFFGSKTVYLDNDIDFANSEVPVTTMNIPEYFATFDGQNHTISNIKILANYYAYNQALFDGHMHIKNLTVDGANVCGLANVGVIGANIHGNIENCHVKRARSYGYSHHVGGIVGLHSWCDIKNCSVEESSIWCYYYGAVGAIAGAKNEESGNITDCSVKSCQLIKEGPLGVYPDWDNTFGIAVGYAYVSINVNNIASDNNTIKGVASDKLCGE